MVVITKRHITAPKKCGLYEIRNRLDGNFYVGSSIHLRRRLDDHKYLLRHNQHPNIRLQRAWNRDGEKFFRFNVLAILEEKDQLSTEQRLIDISLGPNCYNFAVDAVAPMKGRKASAETRAKLSKIRLERFADPKACKKMSDACTKAFADPEIRAQRSALRKAEWADPEGRARRTIANKKKYPTPRISG